MINIFKKNSSVNISIPKPKMVHGVPVKKVPIGKYLEALRELEDLPESIMNDMFPGKTAKEVLSSFAVVEQKDIYKLIGRALIVLPDHVISAISQIIDVDKETIINKLTPAELCDIVKEFWALNDMTDFFGAVSGLIKKQVPTLIDGFKTGSQSLKK